MSERSKDWLDQAVGDLAHARNDLATEFYDWACFSAQQAAEKAVKAVLQSMHFDAWGHSVADLLQSLSDRHPVDAGLIDIALELDKVYIAARYPDALPSGSPRSRYTKAEAERMCEHAERIVQFCQALLSGA